LKKIITFLILSALLIGCGKEIEEPAAQKTKEMDSSLALIYMEQMTNKYLTIEQFSDTKEKEQHRISQAITDVRIVANELNDEFDTTDPLVKDLLTLNEMLEDMLNNALEGNFDNDEASSVGVFMAEISNEHLNGKLPTTLQNKIDEN